MSALETLPPRVREQLAVYRQVRDLQFRVIQAGDPVSADRLLEAAGVTYEIAAQDLCSVPRTGPLLVTANRFGAIECLLLAAVLPRVRPDSKILAPTFVASIPQLRARFIAVDPWRTESSALRNRAALNQAVTWLKLGGALAVFPADDRDTMDGGNSSQVRTRKGWSTALPRLVRITGAATVPVFIEWCETVQGAGLLQPAQSRVEMRIGSPASSMTPPAIPTLQEAATYLRWRTDSLGCRREVIIRLVPRRQAANPAST